MTKLWIVVIALLAASGSACAAEDRGAQSATTPADEASGPPSSVTGVVIDIESQGVADVRGFTLKSGSDVYDLHIADDVDYGFPLGHLSEHLASSDPVKVELEERDGRLYALSIEDV